MSTQSPPDQPKPDAINPYAPPAETPIPEVEYAGAGAHPPMPWSVGEALSKGWGRTKLWWVTLIFAPLVASIIQQVASGVFNGLAQVMADSEVMAAMLTFTGSVASLLLGSFFGVGLLRIFITAARGQPPAFDQLFSGGDRWGAYLGTQLLYGLAVTVGFVLLIVPGVILALGLSQSLYICVDQGKGPVDSLRESWEMMKGHKVNFLGFSIVSVFVIMLGVLALIVGVLPAMAVIYVATAWIYLRLSGQPSDDEWLESR